MSRFASAHCYSSTYSSSNKDRVNSEGDFAFVAVVDVMCRSGLMMTKRNEKEKV